MLGYWMAKNKSESNVSDLGIEQEVLDDPGSAILFEGYPPWLLYFAAGCCVLFMLIGIPGNLITVAALFRTKKLRNATAVFIMNLSVSDLMFCCFNLPLATSTFWQSSWTHGPLLCRLFPLLRYGLVAVSLFTVLAITINRYVMIGHPRLYPKMYKPRYLVLMVLATWISGFGALVATWFEKWGRFGLDPRIGSCSILQDVHGRSPKEFLFILAFLTPCIAIIVCYARIFYIVRKTALKSRRRDKVTTDLVKANIEIKYGNQNLEDSALGSSCGATLTTTENGASPCKRRQKIPRNGSSSSNFNQNESQKVRGHPESPKTEEAPEERFSVETGSLNGAENSQDNSVNDRVENLSNCPVVLRETTSLAEDTRSNFCEENVEFIPFIDNCTEVQEVKEKESDPAIGNSLEPGASQSISNLRFLEADANACKSEKQPPGKPICCLKVPTRSPRSSERPENSDPEKPRLSPKFRQILDTKNLEKDEENGLAVMTRRFLRDVETSRGGLLSPRPTKQARHNRENSDDYASSRSDSPSGERREYSRKASLFRRESRFRSVRNRTVESGKMTAKDKKLLKMILVIFLSFLVCYLPITITKTFKDVIDWRGLNIASYILIYLTTCINPIIYVVMSSEYRSAYKNVLLCRTDSTISQCRNTIGNGDRERRKRINAQSIK